MSVIVYHNPRCSKSRAALAYLDERDVSYTVVPYLQSTPSREELEEVFAELDPASALRRNEAAYAESGLSDESTREEILDAMAAYPILIERPIVQGPRGTVVARPTEAIDAVL